MFEIDIIYSNAASFIILDGGAIVLWSKVDSHEGNVVTTVRVTVNSRSRKKLHLISVLEYYEQALRCCEMTTAPDNTTHVNRPMYVAP